MASRIGHEECVNYLLDKGAEINHKDQVSAVSHAVICYLFGKFPCLVEVT